MSDDTARLASMATSYVLAKRNHTDAVQAHRALAKKHRCRCKTKTYCKCDENEQVKQSLRECRRLWDIVKDKAKLLDLFVDGTVQRDDEHYLNAQLYPERYWWKRTP
jgi:hypothetical protein